jgi:hypothetical protein
MIIVVLSTPLGEVATVRERRGGAILWESVPHVMMVAARADALAWIEGEPTDQNEESLGNVCVECGESDQFGDTYFGFDVDTCAPCKDEPIRHVDPDIAVTSEQAETLQDILDIMDEGTSADGWDIGILEAIDTYLRKRGYVTVDCGDL